MTRPTSSTLLHLIRRTIEGERTRGEPDEELLRRIAAGRDESAFRALVHRHGAVVLDVCRSLLRNEADAEDAFQATFLILVRKAGSIRKAGSLGSWLHGVAYRTALKARTAFARRRRHEAQVPAPEAGKPDDLLWAEVRQVFHEELAQLAERYRGPLVLCYLQGWTQAEAAAALGLSRGTLQRRLETGQQVLRVRLMRRGLGPAAVLLALSWPACSAVSAALEGSTVQAGALGAIAGESSRAAELANGLFRATFATQVRTVAAVGMLLAACAFGASSVLQGQATVLAPRPGVVGAAEREAERRQAALSHEVDRLVGLIRKNPVRRPLGEDTYGLFLIDIAGKEVLPVAGESDAGFDYRGSPSWAADGRRIVFDTTPGKQWHLSLVEAIECDGGFLKRRVLRPGNCPRLSPDGKRLAFVLNPGAVPGAKPGIHIADADGKGARRIGRVAVPRWAPDGRRLLAITFSNPCELTVLDTETGESQAVQLPGHRFLSMPSWTGDDTIVSVVSSAQGTAIALVDVTRPGSALVKEALWRSDGALPVDPTYPVFDPVARRCLFVGRGENGRALYRIDQGQAARPLEPGRFDSKIASLALAPDGRYLLFASDRP